MTWVVAFLAAWLRQRLTGPAAQAIAAAAAVTLALAVVILGLWWLRHDARMDERIARDAYWEMRMANARLQAVALRQARQRRSEEIAGQQAQVLAEELERALRRQTDLESALAKRPRTLAYPKDIIPWLNE